MAEGQTRAQQQPLRVADYLHWTRDVTVSWAYLLPLLAAYEVGVLTSGTDLRNAAESMFKDAFLALPGWTIWLHHLVLVSVTVLAIDLVRRDVPVLRLYPLFLLEAVTLALVFGPAVSWLVDAVGLRPVQGSTTAQQMLLSLGAGIYEEIVFRFILLAGLFTLLVRACHLGSGVAFMVALVFSSGLFALYHHLGAGAEPLALAPLAFRMIAGAFLGSLMALRGLALCVYLHAFYDILCDVRLWVIS